MVETWGYETYAVCELNGPVYDRFTRGKNDIVHVAFPLH